MTDLSLVPFAVPDDDALGQPPPRAVLRAVGRKGKPIDLSRLLTGADLTRTMDGASTLTLTVLDDHLDVIRSPLVTASMDLHYLGHWWRLVKLTKQGPSLSFTFEDRDVAHLRQHKTFRKASRGKMNRAQFVQALVREVKHPPITYICPELHERQRIRKAVATSTARTSAADRSEKRGRGLAADADVTIKGVAPTKEQRRNMQRVIDVAAQLHAPAIPATALVMAVIQETKCMNLTGGDSSSVGILQLLNTWFGGSSAVHGGRRDIEKCCKYFLQHGFFGFGGAMAFSNDHPKESPASVATHTQGNAQGAGHGAKDYEPWEDEAKAWLAAYGYKGSDATIPGTSRTFGKSYEFRRGEPGQPEDSWTCMQRLAEEVRWRVFMDKGGLYFMSDDRLIRGRPALTISEDSPGVEWIDFDVDSGKPVSQVQVTCRADLWTARIGAVVVIKNMGSIIGGRWLVEEIHHDLFDLAATITLKSRQHKLAEPATELVTVQTGEDVSLSGGLRDRIVAVAEASRDSYNKHPSKWFYSQGGRSNADDPTHPPKPGSRSDCSQWVAAVFKKAGAPSPCSGDYASAFTGNMKVKGYGVGIGDLKPGDVIIYGSGAGHHVELYVGPGNKTIGHGSAPVDYGATDMMSGGHGWRYRFLDE
jgi:hypothetical protein